MRRRVGSCSDQEKRARIEMVEHTVTKFRSQQKRRELLNQHRTKRHASAAAEGSFCGSEMSERERGGETEERESD